MSNDALKASFQISASIPELATLEAAIIQVKEMARVEDPHVSLLVQMNLEKQEDELVPFLRDITGIKADPDSELLDINVTQISPETIAIFGETAFPLEVIAPLIQLCCPTALPFGFTFIRDSAKPYAGAYDAGYCLITKQGITYSRVSDQISDLVEIHSDRTHLDPLQKAAFDHYDRADGRLAFETKGLGREAILHYLATDIGQDTLPLFILREVHDARGNAGEAASMMLTAANELLELSRMFDDLAQKA